MSRRLSLQRLPLRPRPRPALSLLVHEIAMSTLRAADQHPRPLGATPSLATFPASFAGIYTTEHDYRTACYDDAHAWVSTFLHTFVFSTVPSTTTILTHIAVGELGRPLSGAEGRLLHSVVVDLMTAPRTADDASRRRCSGCDHDRPGVQPFLVTYQVGRGEHTERHEYCAECEVLIRANWPGTVVRVALAPAPESLRRPVTVRSTEVL